MFRFPFRPHFSLDKFSSITQNIPVQIIDTLFVYLERKDNPLDPKESKTVLTIARIFALFSIEKEEIGVREASQILGIYPSSVYRLFSSLETCGFLEKNANKKYRLGQRIFEIGSLYPYHLSLRKIVQPHAEELARKYDAAAHLAIIRKHPPYSAIIIDRVNNLQSPSLIHRVSLNVPLHSSGVGKALLAFLPLEKGEEVIKSLVLTKFTENTITDRSRLVLELKKIRKNGFATDRGELHPNVFCVGVPIFQNQKLVGSLSLSTSDKGINEKSDSAVAQFLKERGAFISRQL